MVIGSISYGKVRILKTFGIEVASRKQLIENVYDDNEINIMNNVYFKKWAIISPTNVNEDEVNDNT